MTRDIDLLVLVAPNGLGHFRRQVGILSRLLDRIPDLRLHILCADFQIAATGGWDRAARLFGDSRVTWTCGVLDPGVTWSADATHYDADVLSAWLTRCRGLPELDRARLVLSDNLATVLALRPDAVLAGSFLWGDVLLRAHPGSESVQSYADHEARLLERYRPPMLCTRDVVMPAVLERTTPIPMGWMCESVPLGQARSSGRPKIGLLGGATKAADHLLTKFAMALARTDRYEIMLPNGLSEVIGHGTVFHHSSEDYATLAVAVCRPGIGTVTGCVAHGVPMVTLHEGANNSEFCHNGIRLQALGAAVDLGANPSAESVVACIDQVLVPETAARMRTSLQALPRAGLQEAVNYLIARLEGSPA